MMAGANTDIYVVGCEWRTAAAPDDRAGRRHRSRASRPTAARSRSKAIVRATQQLYVMNADGSDQRRISFGGGWYAAPVWSPDGEWIAFTRRIPGAGSRIGIMKPDGTGEKLLTEGRSTKARAGRRAAASCCSSARPGRAAGALPRSRSTGGAAAAGRDPAGRVRPRLVGSDGLMRRAILLLCARRHRRVGPAARPEEARSALPPAPIILGIDALRADFAAQSGSTIVYFGGDSVGPDAHRPRRRSPRRRSGFAASRSRRADRRPWRSERHARSCAGGRRSPRRGSARLSGVAGRSGGAAFDHELGQGAGCGMGSAPEALALNRRAVTVLVR